MTNAESIINRISGWLHPRYAITHLMIVGIVTLLAVAAIFLPSENEASTSDLSSLHPSRTVNDIVLDLTSQTETLTTKDDSLETAATATTSIPAQNWKTYSIRRGDTLGNIFMRAGFSSKDVQQILRSSKQAKQLSKIKPGQQLMFLADDQQQLQKVKLIKNRLDSIELTKTGDSYQLEEINRTPDIAFNFASIVIDGSLFQSANKAKIPDNLTMELASVFGWDIDFVLDIRKGDTFNFVYEEKILDGEKIGHGDIVAAEFIKRGTTYQAVRYIDENGTSRYFTPTGMSMRKEFLRTPIDFAQISSHFNLKRKHPVLHKIRAHKGTDYAADKGTPIKATGNGRVIHAGRKGGYGNTVIIEHGQVYQTVYAHLSKYAKGIKEGSKVTQGQVIGYVGSTGLATGPHLHYEFHVNGQVRNPVTVRFPNSSPISSDEKPRFLAQTQRYMTQLASYTHKLTPTQIALAE